jgi:hypothetical protein
MFNELYRSVNVFFCTHYLKLTERQFQELDLEMPQVKYDCQDIEKSFEDDPPRCCCGEAVPRRTIVTPLYGGRGVQVKRESACSKCGKQHDHEFRLRDGYLMAKDDHGEWCMLIAQDATIVRWFKVLLGKN